MNKFLFIPRPLPEESPSSVLRRMADRHGLVKKCDLSYMYISPTYTGALLYRNHSIPQSIAETISSPEDRENFLSGFYMPITALITKPKIRLLNIEVPSDFIRSSEAAYCSECRKNGQEYFIKDFTLALYCPYHARKYLRRCPTCGQNLAWHWLLDNHCRCPELPESPLCNPDRLVFERRLLDIFRNGESENFTKLIEYLYLLGYRRTDESHCAATRAITLLALAILECKENDILDQLRQLSCLYPTIPKRIICAKLALIQTMETEKCIKAFLSHHQIEPTYNCDSHELPLKSSFFLERPQLYTWLSTNHRERRLLPKEKTLTTLNARFPLWKIERIEHKIQELRKTNEVSRDKMEYYITTKTLKQNLALSATCIHDAVSERLLTPHIGPRHKWLFEKEDIAQFEKKFISIQLLATQSKLPLRSIRKALRRFHNLDVGVLRPAFRRYVISMEQKDAVLKWLNRSEVRDIHAKQPHHVLPHLTGNESGSWLSAKEASVLLRVAPLTVKDLIRAGLLTCKFRLKRGNGYAINNNHLLEFKEKFIGIKESCLLLKCNLHATSRILRSVNILPVTGPGVDRCERNFFIRHDVELYARSLDMQSKEILAYNLADASKALRISKKTIITLIRSGILTTTNSLLKHEILIDKVSVDELYKSYITAGTLASTLKTPVSCVCQELVKNGITPKAGAHQKQLSQNIYELTEIMSVYPSLDTPIEQTVKTTKNHLVSVSAVLSKYAISMQQLSLLFTSSGLVEYLRNPSQGSEGYYLTKIDAHKISKILNRYLTYRQADNCFGRVGLTSFLVRQKKLQAFYPLLPHTNHPMVKRASLLKYIASKTSSQRL
ncbi:hypothetical protein [Pseudomonas pudica]|uniref:TniQ protein n=1 Tax=Pseudomonas pudica TaxID=272772 RepID=A0ABS0FUT7_9PSED|nr:hypothetical protein [Pseudomonas pudica]MBF8644072.1 hypothetical protein [Pseudomonas pudica]MBF8758561.1 hypothetical protein [Pseudomonas pudica]